ncbi:MAG: hypothetical protein WCH99_08825 [Verrucomicrobiota bacterium]
MAADNKPNEQDVVAQLATANASLAAITATGKTAAVLISEHATFSGQVTALTGDKTKLVAGAVLPTDLVAAANTIFNLTVERDNLKAKETSIEQAVAAEVAKLGLVSGKAGGAGEGKTAAKTPTTTEKILAANKVNSLEELATKKANLRNGI